MKVHHDGRGLLIRGKENNVQAEKKIHQRLASTAPPPFPKTTATSRQQPTPPLRQQSVTNSQLPLRFFVPLQPSKQAAQLQHHPLLHRPMSKQLPAHTADHQPAINQQDNTEVPAQYHTEGAVQAHAADHQQGIIHDQGIIRHRHSRHQNRSPYSRPSTSHQSSETHRKRTRTPSPHSRNRLYKTTRHHSPKEDANAAIGLGMEAVTALIRMKKS